ncbi:low-density lipoprotein receptor-related protein 12-like isoform X2 [Branchiostoma lanceolatum]|uniref:low-density lipoprotein receptor-related protein 12-like isoform X2 n=1 Tax=Branchiostoma lanceolatum TaxID=7740 RepID=UPI003454F4FD
MFAMQGGGFLFLAVVVVLGPQAEGQPTANTEQACGRGRVDGSYMGVQGLSGNISSPNYPNMYPGNINCAWRIMVDEGQRIVIVFKALDIEDHGQCSYDYLRIRDGAGTTAASLAKVCGHTLPPSVTSSGNNVLIIFRSDASVVGKGFNIEWSAECLPSLISCGDICIHQSKKCNLTKDCIDWEDENEECLSRGLRANASLKNTGALNIWIEVVASVVVGLAVVVMATVGCVWLCKRQKPRKDAEGHNNFVDVFVLKRGGEVGSTNSVP